MTTQRRPPDKVQCMRSGHIFSRSQLALIENKTYTTHECPVCGYRTEEVYKPCTVFQNVDVDVT